MNMILQHHCSSAFFLVAAAVLAAAARGQEAVSSSDVLESWSTVKEVEYSSTSGETTRTLTSLVDGSERVEKESYWTARSGKKLAFLFERVDADGDFTSAIYGANDVYAFKIVRGEPEGKWQLREIDVGRSRLIGQVEREYDFVYLGTAQAEHFVVLESLVELARRYPDRFSLTKGTGAPNRFAFTFSADGENRPLARTGPPLPSISGTVDVSESPPHLPMRIEWNREGSPGVTYVLEAEPVGPGLLSVLLHGEGETWTAETVSNMKREAELPDDEVFYLSHYGIAEPVLESRSQVNWTAIFLICGGVLLIGFMVARRLTTR